MTADNATADTTEKPWCYSKRYQLTTCLFFNKKKKSSVLAIWSQRTKKNGFYICFKINYPEVILLYRKVCYVSDFIYFLKIHKDCKISARKNKMFRD